MTPAGRLRTLATELAAIRPADDGRELDGIAAEVEEFARAWSGSNLAEHAFTYFHNFEPPPAQASFEVFRRGAMPQIPAGRLLGIGYKTWKSRPRAEVRVEILSRSDALNFATTAVHAGVLRSSAEDAKWEIASILSPDGDPFLTSVRDAVMATAMPTAADLGTQHLKARELTLATDIASAGKALLTAPHEELLFEVQEIRAVYRAAAELSRLARRAADHLDRRRPAVRTPGTHVFIGHGRSPLWRELKDFLVDRLALPYDEFNRVPVAGTTTVARLAEMLDNAAVALLLLTAEDEHADGTLVARQNVIHEAGLFQGRLGFHRAVLLIEEGCQSFSNVAGLTAIPFPRGDLRPAFEQIR